MNRFRELIAYYSKYLRSMKLWLFMGIVIIGVVPCIVLSKILPRTYVKRAIDVRISDVTNQLHIISDHLITVNFLQVSSSEVIDAELAQLSNLYDGRILIIDSGLRIIKDTYSISQNKTIISPEVIRGLRGETISSYNDDDGYIEIVVPIVETLTGADGENIQNIRGVMLTSVATDTISATTERLRDVSDLVTYLAAIFVVVVAYLLCIVLTKPLKILTAAISDVKEGYTSEPVMVRDYLETERISEAFNTVYNRMKLLDDSRQEFVSNVSHELKTPMTSMKVLADSLLVDESTPPELYREFMEDITKEIDRENKIISDLLSLVKMDKTSAELTITQVDINALIELVLKRLRPIARKKDVELEFVSMRAVNASVDEVKISQIVTNLVDNAIKYNREQGWVTVTLDADHQYFTIEVKDSGMGIPEDSIGHIYERFYRVDKSHSREIGGTGLGLAITRSAILMHRGTINVESKPDEGTTFTVRIPIVYIVD
ncbi:MAG: ATP-binding protein [Lachnospiraceae bacterium]|nr:ATP-binding protein [Lachnospiraceae bacterium]